MGLELVTWTDRCQCFRSVLGIRFICTECHKRLSKSIMDGDTCISPAVPITGPRWGANNIVLGEGGPLWYHRILCLNRVMLYWTYQSDDKRCNAMYIPWCSIWIMLFFHYNSSCTIFHSLNLGARDKSLVDIDKMIGMWSRLMIF